MTIYHPPTQITWRDQLKDLQDGLKHADNYAPIMTQYERSMAVDTLRKKLDAVRPHIIQGMLQEYHAAVDSFELARKAEIRERAAEINRWDSGKLASEIQLTQARIADIAGMDDPGGALAGLLQEAEASGDLHKRRAVAEVVKTAINKVTGADLDTRRSVNRAAKQAENILQDIRTTEGMQKANQAASQAFDAIQRNMRDMEFTEKTIGNSIEFQRAWNRLQIDADSGKVEILPKDDPRVTGNYRYTGE